MVSHTKTFDNAQEAEAPAKKKGRSSKKAASVSNEKLEKTTLGDLDVLSSLKSSMEQEEKKGKGTKKKEDKDEESAE